MYKLRKVLGIIAILQVNMFSKEGEEAPRIYIKMIYTKIDLGVYIGIFTKCSVHDKSPSTLWKVHDFSIGLANICFAFESLEFFIIHFARWSMHSVNKTFIQENKGDISSIKSIDNSPNIVSEHVDSHSVTKCSRRSLRICLCSVVHSGLHWGK